ncbi:MAG: hypothetical protein ACKPKO_02700, partial [Candidatus Fonsibacter sp.]
NPCAMSTTVVHQRYRLVNPDSLNCRAWKSVPHDKNATTHGDHKKVDHGVDGKEYYSVRRAGTTTTTLLPPIIEPMKCR